MRATRSSSFTAHAPVSEEYHGHAEDVERRFVRRLEGRGLIKDEALGDEAWFRRPT